MDLVQVAATTLQPLPEIHSLGAVMISALPTPVRLGPSFHRRTAHIPHAADWPVVETDLFPPLLFCQLVLFGLMGIELNHDVVFMAHIFLLFSGPCQTMHRLRGMM